MVYAESAQTGRAMIDLSLTAEQVQLQQTVRRFVAERVLPAACENDLSHRVD